MRASQGSIRSAPRPIPACCDLVFPHQETPPHQLSQFKFITAPGGVWRDEGGGTTLIPAA